MTTTKRYMDLKSIKMAYFISILPLSTLAFMDER